MHISGHKCHRKNQWYLEKKMPKVIVLTDRGVYDTGLCTRVLEQLNGAAYHLYTDIKREPSYLDVEDVVRPLKTCNVT